MTGVRNSEPKATPEITNCGIFISLVELEPSVVSDGGREIRKSNCSYGCVAALWVYVDTH